MKSEEIFAREHAKMIAEMKAAGKTDAEIEGASTMFRTQVSGVRLLQAILKNVRASILMVAVGILIAYLAFQYVGWKWIGAAVAFAFVANVIYQLVVRARRA
ncbi:MAG TPA: hypothetical protein VGC53_18325 [Vicinamibacteria bacterium]